ncbi:MAG: hypothetical protein ACLBM1_01305 [Cuspidothrix sp.]|jgi:succinylglutamate desuccinylase
MVSTVGIISYQGNPHVYPIFINEVAYYEKGTAMYFSKKRVINVE